VPGADNFGGLDSGNTAIWNATYASVPPASVAASGNRYLLAMQPTLTVTSTNATKTYGTDATTAIASNYVISGYQSGVANAFLGDNAGSTFTGRPRVSSSGAFATAPVFGSPYAINIMQGSLAAISGYAFAYNNAGRLTVNPAPVSVTALGGSSFYGLWQSSPGLSATGLQNGEGVGALTGLFSSFGITGVSAPGSYTIGVGGTLTNPNYTLVGTTLGTWSVSLSSGVISGLPSPSNPIPPLVIPVPGASTAALGGLTAAPGKVNVAASPGPSPSPGLSPSPSPPAREAAVSPGSRDASVKPTSRDAGLSPGRPVLAPPAPTSPAASAPALPGRPLSTWPSPIAASPGVATPANRVAGAGCGGKRGTAAGPDTGSSGSAEGCAPPSAASKITSRVVDFALSQLNREELAKSIEREFVETVHGSATPRKVLLVSLAFTSIAFTAGLVGWLLRGGSLVAALLSSIPLWRGFDPLVIVTRSRRSEELGRGLSEVDTLFDGAPAAAAPPHGMPR
jgi:hypothetical protein